MKTENAWSDAARAASAAARSAHSQSGNDRAGESLKVGDKVQTWHHGEHGNVAKGLVGAYGGTDKDGKHDIHFGDQFHGTFPAEHVRKITSNLAQRTGVQNAFGEMMEKMKTQNFGPMPMASDPNDPHQASKVAAGATLMTDHADARGCAMDAIDSSKGGDSKAAADHHIDAAEKHEDQANDDRKAGDHASADDNLQAAAMHRKAASFHSAVRNKKEGVMDRKTMMNQLAANCSCQEARVALNTLSEDVLRLMIENKDKIKSITLNAAGNLSIIRNTQSVSGSGSDTVQEGDEEEGGAPTGTDDHQTSAKAEVFKSKKGKGLEGGPKVGDSSVGGKKSDATENWLRAAPASIRRAYERDRQARIARLTANAASPQAAKQMAAIYNQMTDEALDQLTQGLAPAQPYVGNQWDGGTGANFMGAGAAPATLPVTNEGGEDADILELPTWNYADIRDEHNARFSEEQRNRQRA
jgi:hypothetical protein